MVFSMRAVGTANQVGPIRVGLIRMKSGIMQILRPKSFVLVSRKSMAVSIILMNRPVK